VLHQGLRGQRAGRAVQADPAARDPKGHATLCLGFAPVKGSRIGELAAKWDIVLGYSPEALVDPRPGSEGRGPDEGRGQDREDRPRP
jgi:hypothetical protein